jgi:hypothetical protein
MVAAAQVSVASRWPMLLTAKEVTPPEAVSRLTECEC